MKRQVRNAFSVILALALVFSFTVSTYADAAESREVTLEEHVEATCGHDHSSESSIAGVDVAEIPAPYCPNCGSGMKVINRYEEIIMGTITHIVSKSDTHDDLIGELLKYTCLKCPSCGHSEEEQFISATPFVRCP